MNLQHAKKQRHLTRALLTFWVCFALPREDCRICMCASAPPTTESTTHDLHMPKQQGYLVGQAELLAGVGLDGQHRGAQLRDEVQDLGSTPS